MPEDRCSKCHRYKKNSPSPDISHAGSAAESKCKLDHHPTPCDFLDEDGNPCTVTPDGDTRADEETLEAARRSKEMEDKFTSQSLEMEQLRAEMIEVRKMMGSMRPTANPRDTLFTAAAASTLSTSTEPTPSVTTPKTSLLQPPSGDRSDLLSEAQNLIQLNEKGGSTGHNLHGYSGPKMKDLQTDKTISDEVQRQLNILISNIPALQKVVAGQPATRNLPSRTSLPQSNFNPPT